jgi:hypothetical protein
MTRLARAGLAVEILRAYVTARRALHERPLPDVLGQLRAPRSARRPAGRDPAALARATDRVLGALPFENRCLIRSLVLVRLLACRGVRSDLVVAALPARERQLDAHAWVEVGGRPLLSPGGFEHGRLLTL